jgi:sigma-B regulation protein RsbU (phosphoserine phosphatase)
VGSKDSSSVALCWKPSEGDRTVVPLSGREVFLGRCDECEVKIPHESVSRYHAKILPSAKGNLLVDLGSVNGTFVDGRRVRACVLHIGDRIRLGWSSDVLSYVSMHAAQADDSAELSRICDAAAEPESISDEVPTILSEELHKSLLRRLVIESELRLAREIQRALVPEQLPTIGGYGIRAYSEPAHEVCGDFYDFTASPSGSTIALLGDVAGKGVAASLLSSLALGCMDALLRTGETLESVLETLNTMLCEKESPRFVTLFILEFDARGRCRYASAGHETAYVYRAEAGEIDELRSLDTVVGAFAEQDFSSEPFQLQAGDVLLAYSDGLTDATRRDGDMLGAERVREAVLEYAPAGAESLRSALLDLLQSFSEGVPQCDDVTLFAIERLPERT